jgi:hypothetical protein
MEQMRKQRVVFVAMATAMSIGGASLSAREAGLRAPTILAANYSASGTHQCRAADGNTHSCVVTGLSFGTCIEADSSLRAQDCCPSTRICERDAQGRETQCRRGGASAGFALNYCIPGL